MQSRENRHTTGTLIAIAILLLVSLLVDIWLMFDQIRQQTMDASISQLQSVSRELENSIGDASNLTMQMAIGAEDRMDDRESLEAYIARKKEGLTDSDNGAINLYMAGPGWHISPGYTPPKDYVATERPWYKGAVSSGGKTYVSAPYQDVVTGEVCYSVSVALSDGESVLAVDYNMDAIQTFISKMDEDEGFHAVIVTDEDIIAGYGDDKLVGKPLANALPEYTGILALAKGSDGVVSSRIKSDHSYNHLVASRFANGWYLIISTSDWDLHRVSYLQLFFTIMLALALFVTVVMACVFVRKGWLEPDRTPMDEKEHEERVRSLKQKETQDVNKKYRNRILIFMILVMVLSMYTNIAATYRWGNAQMRSEGEAYETRISEWIDTQKSILDMFASIISTNPEMLNDYQGTVDTLNSITEQYPAISVSYVANPDLRYSVIMNTGWKPDPDVVIEERPWYVGAMEAKDGWYITAPYYDQQTGGYCVTMSEQILDARTGEFLGVFGIDFFMDGLIGILGDSYSDEGYAFLVDTEGIIVNHPYGKYQMSQDNQTSVLELPYGKVEANGEDTRIFRDYDGSLKILLAKVNQKSKFSIYVVLDAWLIYGQVIVYGSVCLAAFLVCLILIFRLLTSLIAWQEEVNRRLEKAARTDAMTGLLNKASVEAAISRKVKHGSGVLLIFDLDSFKLVNDIYGHEMGDRVLIRASGLIQSIVRENDIVGRIGGDEFIAYCDSLMDEEVLGEKVEYLNQQLLTSAREYMGKDMEIPLGCSVGAVLVPEGGREYSVLFSKADQVLHQAKSEGKHVLRIHQDRTEAKVEETSGELSRLQMVFGERNQKRSAMVTDRESFRSVYQFMMRFAASCACDLHLVAFDLQADREEELADGADRFAEIAAQNLRGCDVILEYNSKQVLVLLVDADEAGYMVPIQRILDAWEAEGNQSVSVSFHHAQLDTRREERSGR